MPASLALPQASSPAPRAAAPADLWGQVTIPSIDWAQKHPEKLMAFLMVAQIDFPELSEMLK